MLFITAQARFSFIYTHLSHRCSGEPLTLPWPLDLRQSLQPAAPPGSLFQQLWDSSLSGDPGAAAFRALTRPCPSLPQVVSPLTESVLGETLLTVTEEKVSVTQLQAQVVASLALSLRPSPGSSHTILATTAAQQTLSFLKQVTGCPACQPGGWSVEGGLTGSDLPVCHESPSQGSR